MYVSGANVYVDWSSIRGSIVAVSTEGLEDWLIQHGVGQWEPRWGDQPDDWSQQWDTFWPAGKELTVYVWPHHNSGDAFPCP